MNYQKDPAARLSYSINWLDWLGENASIVTSVWTVPDGLILSSQEITGGYICSVLIAGGEDKRDYEVTNKITTAAGLINVRSFRLQIRAHLSPDVASTSRAKQILDAIDALMIGKATKDQAEYQIGDRMLKRYALSELIALRTHYSRLYSMEQQAARLKSGAPFFKNILTRFDPTR